MRLTEVEMCDALTTLAFIHKKLMPPGEFAYVICLFCERFFVLVSGFAHIPGGFAILSQFGKASFIA
ncbi:MAG: hypothetical protein SFX19_01700 [Alphaproteobacteria bacterium]|nr:hypothetical protein [Alphaproteobacteria bacterium]